MKLLLVFALAWSASAAQTVTNPRYPVHLHTDSVRKELSVMATVSYHLRREQSRCVTRWRMERTGGELHITLLALGPSEVAWSDSLNVAFYPTRTSWDSTFATRVCSDSLPDIHSHIVDNGMLYDPSEVDMETAQRSPALFRFLMSVPDSANYRLTLYGMRGRP